MKQMFWAPFVFSLTLAGATQAQESQQDLVGAGHEFALKVCAYCHVVAKDQPSPPILKRPGPSFFALAARRGLDAAALRRFLSRPHGNWVKSEKMPDPMLLDYQIDKISAYLDDLRKQRSRAK